MRFFVFSDRRKIIVIFKGTSLLLNCTTFVNINNSPFNISNFKSSFYWFANKKHEIFFAKFKKKTIIFLRKLKEKGVFFYLQATLLKLR